MVVSSAKRLEWIDWMKALGIYLVVLGHFSSFGEKFIYVFHMPLFFLISGFLCKKESDSFQFWRKLWYNLAVPMLMMTILNFMGYCVLKLIHGSFELVYVYWFVRNVLFGIVSGFDSLWFVYTLILLKIIFQYCSSRKLFYALTIIMLALVYVYNRLDFSGFPFFLKERNSFINVFIAYPFFALGVFVRDYKYLLNEWDDKRMQVFLLTCGLLPVAFCYYFNGSVGLHRCDDGGNIFLCLLGGVAGSIMMFSVSKLLGHASKFVVIISRGTIIILGFHKILISLMRILFPVWYTDIVLAALIVIVFVPVILAIERYCPLMAGKYRAVKLVR